MYYSVLLDTILSILSTTRTWEFPGPGNRCPGLDIFSVCLLATLGFGKKLHFLDGRGFTLAPDDSSILWLPFHSSEQLSAKR